MTAILDDAMRIVLAADERALPSDVATVDYAWRAIASGALTTGQLLEVIERLESIIRRPYVTRPRVRRVASASKPGLSYTLTRLGTSDTWACTCPGYTHRGRCKHTRGG
jgi:hypothetical protein